MNTESALTAEKVWEESSIRAIRASLKKGSDVVTCKINFKTFSTDEKC